MTTYFDLCALEKYDNSTPVNLIKWLLNPEQDHIKLFISENDFDVINSDSKIHVGYPLVTVNDDVNAILPLITWEIMVHPQDNHFVLTKTGAAGICKELQEHCSEKFGFDVLSTLQTLKGEKLLDNKTVLSLSNLFAANCGWDDEYVQTTLKKIPMIISKDHILWSAIITDTEIHPFEGSILAPVVFEAKSPDETAGSDMPDLTVSAEIAEEDAQILPPVEVSTDGTMVPIGLLSTSPEQEAVVQRLKTPGLTLVEGAAGTGKSYNIAAALTYLIANDKTALVITDDPRNAGLLEVILNHCELSDYVLRLKDDEDGRISLCDRLRSLPDLAKKRSKLNEQEWRKALRETRYAVSKLEEAHKALNQPVLEGDNWAKTTTRFLQAQRQQGKQLLNSLLETKDFKWTDGEFSQIRKELTENEDLLKAIASLQHPLNILGNSVFDKEENDADLAAESTLKSYISRTNKLYHHIANLVEDYGDSLKLHYEDYTRQYLHRTRTLIRKISDYTKDYGKDFDEFGALTKTKLKLLGVFSSKYRETQASKDELLSQYEQLQKDFYHKSYFEYRFSPIKGSLTFEKISQNLKEFEASLLTWKRHVPSLVKEDTKRVNRTTPTLEGIMKKRVEDAEQEFTEIFKEFNNSGFFSVGFKADAYSLNTKREYLETVLADLNKTYFALRDFRPYYRWKKNWLSINPSTQKVVEACMKAQPLDWQIAFESWYVYNLQLFKYTPDLPDDLFLEKPFMETISTLRAILPDKIKLERNKYQLSTLQSLKSNNRELFKAYFSKNNLQFLNDKPYSGIFSTEHTTLKAGFPIIITDAETALNTFIGSNYMFDAIMVDNADLVQEQTLALAANCTHFAAFTNPRTTSINLAAALAAKDATTIVLSSVHIPFAEPKPEFADLAALYISDYVSPDRISKSVPVLNTIIDLVINPTNANQKPIAVICDGVLRDALPHSFEKSAAILNKLEEAGYTVVTTWSSEWQRSPEKAARKIAAMALQNNSTQIV